MARFSLAIFAISSLFFNMNCIISLSNSREKIRWWPIIVATEMSKNEGCQLYPRR